MPRAEEYEPTDDGAQSIVERFGQNQVPVQMPEEIISQERIQEIAAAFVEYARARIHEEGGAHLPHDRINVNGNPEADDPSFSRNEFSYVISHPCESISIAMGQTRDHLIDLGNQVTAALMGCCGFFSAEQPDSDAEQNEPLIIGDVRNSA